MTREIIARRSRRGTEGERAGFTIRRSARRRAWSRPGRRAVGGQGGAGRLREKYLYLQTSKDERYFFAYEDVLGLRCWARSSAKDGSAGFGR
jgi:hypothetical protein